MFVVDAVLVSALVFSSISCVVHVGGLCGSLVAAFGIVVYWVGMMVNFKVHHHLNPGKA